MFLVCHILIWLSLIFVQHECLGIGYAVCVHVHIHHRPSFSETHTCTDSPMVPHTQMRACLVNCHTEKQICQRDILWKRTRRLVNSWAVHKERFQGFYLRKRSNHPAFCFGKFVSNWHSNFGSIHKTTRLFSTVQILHNSWSYWLDSFSFPL